MGLDISCFGGLTPSPDAELDEDGFPLDDDKFVRLDAQLIHWTEQNFPGRTAGLVEPGINYLIDANRITDDEFVALFRFSPPLHFHLRSVPT
jgi:hypothetical protein